MRIVLANDHAGVELKAALAEHLSATTSHVVNDIGVYSPEPPVDYPPICADAARRVVRGEADMAVVIGGSGQGEAMAANKVRGARAALCHDEFTARFARRHNDANVLSLGARIVAPELAAAILDVFIAETFDGGRHVARVLELATIEDEEAAAED